MVDSECLGKFMCCMTLLASQAMICFFMSHFHGMIWATANVISKVLEASFKDFSDFTLSVTSTPKNSTSSSLNVWQIRNHSKCRFLEIMRELDVFLLLP